jgi:hypothetical protein
MLMAQLGPPENAMLTKTTAALSSLVICSLLGYSAVAHEGKRLKLDINFAQTFIVAPCPANAPTADFCLSVTGVATVPEVGQVQFDRVVLINGSLFDPAHPTCIPDETTGTLTLPGGTITIHAPGNVCFIDGTAAYAAIITGGTGKYAGALGGGQIFVPPPETNTTGREIWHLEVE